MDSIFGYYVKLQPFGCRGVKSHRVVENGYFAAEFGDKMRRFSMLCLLCAVQICIILMHKFVTADITKHVLPVPSALGMRRVVRRWGTPNPCLSRTGFPKGLPCGLPLLHTFLSNREKYGVADIRCRLCTMKTIPQSPSVTAPFTQVGLWFCAPAHGATQKWVAEKKTRGQNLVSFKKLM